MRLVVVVLEERTACLGVPLDRHLVLAGQRQRLRVGQLFGRPRSVAVPVERPVVPVRAERHHQLFGRGPAQVLRRAVGHVSGSGNGPRIVPRRMLVVGHQHQEIGGGGEPLDGHALRFGGQIDGDEKAARMQLAPERLHERCQLLPALGAQRGAERRRQVADLDSEVDAGARVDHLEALDVEGAGVEVLRGRIRVGAGPAPNV